MKQPFAKALIAAAVITVQTAPTAAKDNPYRNADKVASATAPNGSRVNPDLAGIAATYGTGEIIRVRPQVTTFHGYTLVNCTVVETPEGLVVFDTGNNRGEGENFARLIRQVSDKPVIAIIYSHSHYTRGAGPIAALVAAGKAPLVIGHPLLERNLASQSLDLGPARMRRVAIQFGSYLPETGPDARITFNEPHFDDPSLQAPAHQRITRPVADGETIGIGGLDFTFYHAQYDTDDSLAVWIPSLGTVLTNNPAFGFMPMYTLRGEVYRAPVQIIASYTRLRDLGAQYLVPTHGRPQSGATAIRESMGRQRDAYAFTYAQSVRAINKGWTPDEMVDRIELPASLRTNPELAQGYGEFDYALRGQYRGLMGWFAEDTSELNPPSRMALGAEIVDATGGIKRLLARSDAALDRGDAALAATLAGYAVDADPDNRLARLQKAKALRRLAQVSRGLQSHNFYLTEALHLEGRINRFDPPPEAVFASPTPESMMAEPARQVVQLLEFRIDPEQAAGVNTTVVIGFTDGGQPMALAVRDGVAELLNQPPSRDLGGFRISRLNWHRFLLGKLNAKEVAQTVEPNGMDTAAIAQFLAMFI